MWLFHQYFVPKIFFFGPNAWGPVKGAVYTVGIFICICMSLRVFLFAKKMKFLTKGGIHCISQVFPWHFYFMREHSLVELTEHDDSAANIIVHSVYPYSRLNLVLAYGISPEFRCGVHSLSVHTNMYYECSSTYMYTYYVR